MILEEAKNRILESSIGYSLWSAPLNRRKVEAVKQMLSAAGKESGAVLDIGCGPGSNTALFAGWNYLGVDLNSKYIDDARARFVDAEFKVGNATDPPVGDRRFDVVLVNSLMHHLNDEQCSVMLRQISRICNPDGVVIVQEPLIPEPGEKLKHFFMLQDRGEYFRSLAAWQQLFIDAGFSIASESFYTLKLANLVTAWKMYSILLRPADNTR